MTDFPLHVFSYTGVSLQVDPFSPPIREWTALALPILEAWKAGPEFDFHEALTSLAGRETIYTTAAGGVALPHAEIESLTSAMILILCDFDPPIPWPWGAVDKVPVEYALLLLIPKLMRGGYIRIQSTLSRASRSLVTNTQQHGDFKAFLRSELARYAPIWHDQISDSLP